MNKPIRVGMLSSRSEKMNSFLCKIKFKKPNESFMFRDRQSALHPVQRTSIYVLPGTGFKQRSAVYRRYLDSKQKLI